MQGEGESGSGRARAGQRDLPREVAGGTNDVAVQPQSLFQILLHTKSVLKHGTKVTASCSVPQRSRCGVLLRRDLSVALSAANAEPRHLRESEHSMRAACRGAQETDTRDDGAVQANTLICMCHTKQ